MSMYPKFCINNKIYKVCEISYDGASESVKILKTQTFYWTWGKNADVSNIGF